MDANRRAMLKATYLTRIREPGAWRRFRGPLSDDDCLTVLRVCLEVKEESPHDNLGFKHEVKRRLQAEPYRFGAVWLLFAVKLIALFIELWFLFDTNEGEHRPCE